METYRVPEERPPVVVWYRVYCGLMAGLYLLVLAAGIFLATVGPEVMPDVSSEDAMAMEISGWVYLVLGAVFFVPFAMGLFLGNAPWCWIYGIVLICLSFTSVCCLPAGIPLLIFWIKPETKAWYGRS